MAEEDAGTPEKVPIAGRETRKKRGGAEVEQNWLDRDCQQVWPTRHAGVILEGKALELLTDSAREVSSR